MAKWFVAIAAALCCVTAAMAAVPEQTEITALYRRALAGDKAAVELCIAKLEAVVQSQPANQLARVYLGSAYTLRSRDMGFGPAKLKTLRQGVAVMNEAVAAAPADPKVRLSRALTTSALPGILGYKADARKHFEDLVAMAQRAPGAFEPADLQIIYYNAGLAENERGHRERAAALWKEAL